MIAKHARHAAEARSATPPQFKNTAALSHQAPCWRRRPSYGLLHASWTREFAFQNFPNSYQKKLKKIHKKLKKVSVCIDLQYNCPRSKTKKTQKKLKKTQISFFFAAQGIPENQKFSAVSPCPHCSTRGSSACLDCASEETVMK